MHSDAMSEVFCREYLVCGVVTKRDLSFLF